MPNLTLNYKTPRDGTNFVQLRADCSPQTTSPKFTMPSYDHIRGVLFVLIMYVFTAASAVRSGRIVGGNDAADAEFPYAASLTRRGVHFCGATVIDRRWLLTAAHCMCNGLGRPMRAEQIRATLGQQRLSVNRIDNGAAGISSMPIERVVIHPRYSCTQSADDIALLRLADAVRLAGDGGAVGIVRLPLSGRAMEDLLTEETGEAPIGRVCGWGWTVEDLALGDRSDRLQKAEVNLWSASRCQRMYADAATTMANGLRFGRGQFCAGRLEGGVDACWADSGGPLVVRIAANDFLMGVVSTGIGCARRGLPGIYTAVPEYLEWIANVVGE